MPVDSLLLNSGSPPCTPCAPVFHTGTAVYSVKMVHVLGPGSASDGVRQSRWYVNLVSWCYDPHPWE